MHESSLYKREASLYKIQEGGQVTKNFAFGIESAVTLCARSDEIASLGKRELLFLLNVLFKTCIINMYRGSLVPLRVGLFFDISFCFVNKRI